MRAPSRHERRRRAPSASLRAGFTLVEMLVVMGIIATVGVVVVITMASVGERSSREGARENVMDVLRQARMSAMDSGRGSLVRINASEGTIYGLASTVQAAWHFETVDPISNLTPGAKSMNGTVTGATVAPGKVGLCLNFTGGGGVNCQHYPVYDQTAGIRLEAWVCPAAPPPSPPTPYVMGIIGKGDATAGIMSYVLGLAWYGSDVGYGVHAGFVIDDASIPGIALTSYNPATGNGTALQPNEWHHVAVEFDGFEGRLFIDGRLVDLDSYRADEAGATDPNPVPDPNPGPPPGTDDAFAAPARIVPARGADLTIGSAYIACPGIPAGTYYFQGLIDEPKLLSVAGGDPVYLPQNVPMVLSDPVVHFDSLARLDTAYHGGTSVSIAVGDPYQAAKLAADIYFGDPSLTVSPANPFASTGGFIMVGPDTLGKYEVMQYSGVSATDPNELTLNGTVVTDHVAGEKVLFARLVVVDQMGEVKRETLRD